MHLFAGHTLFEVTFLKEVIEASAVLENADVNVSIARDLVTTYVDLFNLKRNETGCQQLC